MRDKPRHSVVQAAQGNERDHVKITHFAFFDEQFRKSTSVALLLRFYDPYDGSVLIDGHDIRTLNLSWLRSQMGFVQQEPVLFNLSIKQNIAYGDNTRHVSQSEIEEAAKKANIHDRIISLPDVSNARVSTTLIRINTFSVN